MEDRDGRRWRLATLVGCSATVALVSMFLPRARPLSREDFADQYHQPAGWPKVDAFFFPWLGALELGLLVALVLAVVVATWRPSRARAARRVAAVAGGCLVVVAGANVIAPGGGQIEFRALYGAYLGLVAAAVVWAAALSVASAALHRRDIA